MIIQHLEKITHNQKVRLSLVFENHPSTQSDQQFLVVIMGGDSSKSQRQQKQQVRISPDPLIQRIRKTMKLELNQASHATYSFLNQNFSRQIAKNKDGRINQDYSPYCFMFLQHRKENQVGLITCALISPIIAMSSIDKICDPSGFIFIQKLTLLGVYGGRKVKSDIKKILAIKQSKIALLVLEKPIWELGWCGVTYLESSDEIGNMPVYSIFNVFTENQKQIVEYSEEIPIISQKIQKIYCKESSNFEGKSARLGENLLVKMIQKKPYLVGVQQQQKCIFFTKQSIKSFQDKVKQYITPSLQKQYLKNIDLQQMQIQSAW